MMQGQTVRLPFLFMLLAVGLGMMSAPARADFNFVNNDPLVWELACPPADCSDDSFGLNQTALIEFSFFDTDTNGGSLDPDEIRMQIAVDNTSSTYGQLTALAMEMPEQFIMSVTQDLPADVPSGWQFEYSAEAFDIPPFGGFDLCLTHDSDMNVSCKSGQPIGIEPGDQETFNLLITLDDPVADLPEYVDANGTTFEGVDAFRGHFGAAIVNSENDVGQGICGRFQSVGADGELSAKVCGTLQTASDGDVPEPASFALLTLGLIGVAGIGASQRRKAAAG